jgi:acyl carrier protein
MPTDTPVPSSLETHAMSRDIEHRIVEIIAREAQIDASRLGPETTMDQFDVPSITQFEVLFAVEEAFDVQLPDRLEDMTLGGLAAEVARLLRAKEPA